MPVKVKVHDKQSQVPINICNDKSQVRATSGSNINDKRLDLKINQEIKDREEADAYLQEQIDDLSQHEGAREIRISDVDVVTGSIDISLLDQHGQVISTGTLTNESLRPQYEEGTPYEGKIVIEKGEEYAPTSVSNSVSSSGRRMLKSMSLQSMSLQQNEESNEEGWHLIPGGDSNWNHIPDDETREVTQEDNQEWHLIPSASSDWHLIPN